MLSTAYCHHLQTLRRENRRFDKSRAPAKKKKSAVRGIGREESRLRNHGIGSDGRVKRLL